VSEEAEKSGAVAEARAAEQRAELAATDERRAEEELAEAHDAVEAAEKEESKKERKRREAEEREQAASAEAQRARERAERAVEQPGATEPLAQPDAGGPRRIEGPEKPELYVAAAFAGAFLFARILRKIAE
jgi:hypothetical protein